MHSREKISYRLYIHYCLARLNQVLDKGFSGKELNAMLNFIAV